VAHDYFGDFGALPTDSARRRRAPRSRQEPGVSSVGGRPSHGCRSAGLGPRRSAGSRRPTASQPNCCGAARVGRAVSLTVHQGSGPTPRRRSRAPAGRARGAPGRHAGCRCSPQGTKLQLQALDCRFVVCGVASPAGGRVGRPPGPSRSLRCRRVGVMCLCLPPRSPDPARRLSVLGPGVPPRWVTLLASRRRAPRIRAPPHVPA
jgi:hypothetical protein